MDIEVTLDVINIPQDVLEAASFLPRYPKDIAVFLVCMNESIHLQTTPSIITVIIIFLEYLMDGMLGYILCLLILVVTKVTLQ